MEVACGEYGDKVPKLVVSTRAGKCRQFQNLQKKLVNCDKIERVCLPSNTKEIACANGAPATGYDESQQDYYETDMNLSNLNLDCVKDPEDFSDGDLCDVTDNPIGGQYYASNGNLASTKVTVNLQNPGYCDTLLVKDKEVGGSHG